MTRKSLEELITIPQLEDGRYVEGIIGDDTFDGKIVGMVSNGLVPIYIVECLDNSLPNETYPYRFAALPLTEINID